MRDKDLMDTKGRELVNQKMGHMGFKREADKSKGLGN